MGVRTYVYVYIPYVRMGVWHVAAVWARLCLVAVVLWGCVRGLVAGYDVGVIEMFLMMSGEWNQAQGMVSAWWVDLLHRKNTVWTTCDSTANKM